MDLLVVKVVQDSALELWSCPNSKGFIYTVTASVIFFSFGILEL